MSSDETALVLVLPEDGADAVVAKLRDAGARSVQLLVSEGAVALRRPEVAARLHNLAIAEGIDLTLISSDPATVENARNSNIQTLLVQDARVIAPGRSNRSDRPASPYSTRVLERQPPPPPRPRRPAPVDPDAAALRAIDELDVAPQPTTDDDVDAALAAALRERATDEDFLAASLRDAPAEAPYQPPPSAPPRAERAERAATLPVPVRRIPAAPPARRRSPWPLLLLLVLLLAVVAIGALLFLTSRVTVTVAAPVRPDTVETITALPVPIGEPGTVSDGTAVEAVEISSDVTASEEGEVTEGTMTPSGTASGVVNILNSSPQSILLPAGTEFIAVRADGQEVPFVSTEEVLVPGATTADQGAQIITTRGQAQVPVIARSPGSGSNVEANTIRRMTPPGGPTFNTDGGNLIVTNEPIGGGSEQEVRIVKDSNVQALLASALERLDSEARRQLEGLAQARGLAIDATTITPRRADLEQLQGFELNVSPPVGSPLDSANPRFTVTVQARYSALATPPNAPIQQQLGGAFTEQLRRAGRLQPGDCRAPAVTGWRWDGERLLVDGQVAPDTRSPGCEGGLDADAIERVREAVRGKSRAEAEAALQALVAEGVIGSYELPATERLPGYDWQINIATE